MKNIRRKVMALATPALALAVMTATPAAVASAATAGSTIGPCYLWSDNISAGGWCNGTGPTWQYGAVAYCVNGFLDSALIRWAGDRRGSYGHCSTDNTQLSYGIMYVYYGNQIKCEFYIAPGAGSTTTPAC